MNNGKFHKYETEQDRLQDEGIDDAIMDYEFFDEENIPDNDDDYADE